MLQLTPFSVTADADTGYIARDSLAGSRLNTALKDTPASLSVLTKEFLEDIGATTLEEAMAWSTNSQMQMQDTLTLASTAVGWPERWYSAWPPTACPRRRPIRCSARGDSIANEQARW